MQQNQNLQTHLHKKHLNQNRKLNLEQNRDRRRKVEKLINKLFYLKRMLLETQNKTQKMWFL